MVIVGTSTMNQTQLDAYRSMYKAITKALDEIHNPGFNRTCGIDIVEHLNAVRAQAERCAPEDF